MKSHKLIFRLALGVFEETGSEGGAENTKLENKDRRCGQVFSLPTKTTTPHFSVASGEAKISDSFCGIETKDSSN